MTIPRNKLQFSVNPKVAASVHDGGIVLLHTASGHFFACNSTGARIWQRVGERQPLEIIVNDISNNYQIDVMTAQGHVEAFLVELEQQKLIQREMPS